MSCLSLVCPYALDGPYASIRWSLKEVVVVTFAPAKRKEY